MTAPAVIDPAPRRLLYEHARWLFDAEEARLSSIESRSTTLLGWAGTQLTLILGATALLSPLDASGWKTAGLWLLAVTVLASVGAISVLLANVMRTSTLPAAHRDLRDKLNELNTETFESDDLRYTEIHVAQPLAENLIGAGEKHPNGALADLATMIDVRAKWLNAATAAIGVSLSSAAMAAVFFLISTQGA